MKNDNKCMECSKPVPKKHCGWLVGQCGGCTRDHWCCPACAKKLGIQPMPEA